MSALVTPGTAGRWLTGALFVAVVAVANGCVLVVPELQHDAHCGFDGATACAACLRTSCQVAIDACCNDSACSGEDGHSTILDALDKCGTGDGAGCANGLGATPAGEAGATATTAGAIRSCVTTSCNDACLSGAVIPVVPVPWSCGARTGTSACATCIYDSCATALEECCGDSSCSASTALQDDLSRCTSADAPGCAYSRTEIMSGYEGAVRGCIMKSCATECLGDGRLHESCNLEAGGSYCTCSDAETSKGPTCSVASMGGACVLGEKGCTCGHYTCSTSDSVSGGCTCGFHGDSDATSTQRCDVERSGDPSGGCCIERGDSGFTCACADYLTSCLPSLGQYTTPTCSWEDVQKALSDVLVASCSN